MARKVHTEEEILRVLREAEAGRKVGGDLPQAWDQPTELLPVEEETRRARAYLRELRQLGGERQAQAPGRQSLARPPYPAGDFRKQKAEASHAA
jgi:hypothetical protein